MRQGDILDSDPRKMTGCPRLTFAEKGRGQITEGEGEMIGGVCRCVCVPRSWEVERDLC